jgi:hypothetical protein
MYPEFRTRPIPFVDPLRSAAMVAPHAVVAMSGEDFLTTHVPAPMRARGATAVRAAARGDGTRHTRMAMARYDGDNALNVRSCTTGQVYRFTHPGAVVTIDAADISLMKRIDLVTVLS